MSANSPWTPDEIKKVVEAFKIVRNHNFQIGGTPLPTQVFFAWLATLYAIAIEVIITSDEKSGMIYLIQRPESDPFYANLWHTPGSVLLPKELMAHAVLRIVKDEVGIIFLRSIRFIHHFDNISSPRGHEPAMLFHIQLSTGTKPKIETGQWFPIDQLPELVPFHYNLIAKFREKTGT